MANDTTIRISAIDATTEAFRSIQGNIGRLQNSIKGIAGPLSAAFSVGAIASFSKQLIDAADRLSDLATVTGISASELSKFGNAAQLNGSSTEQFEQAIVKFSNSIGEAAAGSTAQVEAFKALGISIQDANGNIKPTIDLFKEVADRFSQTADGAGKVAVAQDLLGKSGSSLIPVLNQGAAALERYEATFSEDFIQASADFNDNLDKLTINFQRLAATNLTPFLQAVNELLNPASVSAADQLKNKIAELQGILNASVGTSFLEKLLGKDLGSGKIRAEIERLQELLREINRADAAIASRTPTVKPAIKMAKKGQDEVADFQTFSEAAGIRIFEMDYKALSKEVGDFVTFQEAVNEKVKEFDYQNFIKEQEELNKVVEMSKITMKDFGERSVLSIEDALMDLVQGTKTAKEAFGDMAKSIIADLLRMYIRAQITIPIFNALFGGQPTSSGGGGVGVGVGTRPPGFQAIGGSVQAGNSYVVGERGPELFVPARSGSIVPNDQMGGGSVVIQQTINVTTGVQQTVRTEIAALLPQISEAAKAAVLDAKKRGGSFSAAFA